MATVIAPDLPAVIFGATVSVESLSFRQRPRERARRGVLGASPHRRVASEPIGSLACVRTGGMRPFPRRRRSRVDQTGGGEGVLARLPKVQGRGPAAPIRDNRQRKEPARFPPPVRSSGVDPQVPRRPSARNSRAVRSLRPVPRCGPSDTRPHRRRKNFLCSG